jgi:hypothetical protein
MGAVSLNNYSGEQRFNVIMPYKITLYDRLNGNGLATPTEYFASIIDQRCHYSVHSPNAKKIYYYNAAGVQVRSETYPELQGLTARHELIDLINECIIQTRLEKEREGLSRLLDDILEATSDRAICAIIRTALAEVAPGRYEVNTHSKIFSRLLGDKTHTHQVLAGWLRTNSPIEVI